MARFGSKPHLVPLTWLQRGVIVAAILLAVIAATIFVVVLVVGSGGGAEVGRIFSPIAIAATALGLVASLAAVVDARTRTVGITTMLVLVPCAFLAALSLVALGSR